MHICEMLFLTCTEHTSIMSPELIKLQESDFQLVTTQLILGLREFVPLVPDVGDDHKYYASVLSAAENAAVEAALPS